MTHRRALDHILELVAGHPCGDSLVLRGSVAMLAWVGDRARPPGDIDWVVRPLAGALVDSRSPYPHVQNLDRVRLWPEVAHGAGNPRIWDLEDLDTGGFAPRLPPEGLRWVEAEDLRGECLPHRDVLELLDARASTADGLVFDPDAVRWDATWDYDYELDGGGVRVRLPWRQGDEQGSVQLDFAYDEALPEAPVFVAVPRGDGGPPNVVWSATRELSLAWKLRWLASDQLRAGSSAGKDLYDAVQLVELDGIRLSGWSRRTASHFVPQPDMVLNWAIDWSMAGDPREWLDRLAAGIRRLQT